MFVPIFTEVYFNGKLKTLKSFFQSFFLTSVLFTTHYNIKGFQNHGKLQTRMNAPMILAIRKLRPQEVRIFAKGTEGVHGRAEN